MKKLFVFAAVALFSMSMFAENITVAKAIEIGKALASGAKTSEKYTVEGYVGKIYGSFNNKYGSQSYWMTDVQFEDAKFTFEAYQCTADAPVHVGDKVTVTGYIENYNDGSIIEIKSGETAVLAAVEPELMDFADAVAACVAVKDPNEGKSNFGKYVIFRGYVQFAYDFKEGQQSAWLAAEKGAESGEIQAYYLKATAAVAVGDYVEVTGTVAKYNKSGEMVNEIVDGTIEKVAETAIENTAVSVKAQKVMENGQLYIIRNGVKYNAAGTVVE